MSLILQIVESGFLSAAVKVFQVDQTCEVYRWTYPLQHWTGGETLGEMMPKEDFKIFSKICVVRTVSSHFEMAPVTDSKPKCFGSTEAASDCTDQKQSVVLSQRLAVDRDANLAKVSVLLCRPSYSIAQREVTTTSGHLAGRPGSVVNIATDNLEIYELGIPETNLTYGLLTWFSPSPYPQMIQEDEYLGTCTVDPWVSAMNWTGQHDTKAFDNLTVWSDLFQKAFKSMVSMAVMSTRQRSSSRSPARQPHLPAPSARCIASLTSSHAASSNLTLYQRNSSWDFH